MSETAHYKGTATKVYLPEGKNVMNVAEEHLDSLSDSELETGDKWAAVIITTIT